MSDAGNVNDHPQKRRQSENVIYCAIPRYNILQW